jgi:hypothetical protein
MIFIIPYELLLIIFAHNIPQVSVVCKHWNRVYWPARYSLVDSRIGENCKYIPFTHYSFTVEGKKIVVKYKSVYIGNIVINGRVIVSLCDNRLPPRQMYFTTLSLYDCIKDWIKLPNAMPSQNVLYVLDFLTKSQ